MNLAATNLPIAILTIGNEITDGRVADTNSSFLSRALSDHGYQPSVHLSCQDDTSKIVSAVKFLEEHAKITILSGGLGPTSDDKTRDALAKLVEKKLVLDQTELARLKAYFRKRKRDLDPANRVQAMVPEGAVLFENSIGTASGIYLKTDRNTHLYALPGVPAELKKLTADELIPHLAVLFPPSTLPSSHHFTLFGLPESKVGRWISQLSLSEHVLCGYRPHFPELEVRLSTGEDSAFLNDGVKRVREALGEEYIVSESGVDLPNVATELLLEQQKSISVAESCTGGLLGKLLTDRPGSSAYFVGGGLTYSNKAKEKLLKVSQDTLTTYGAVSSSCAEEMATGAREYFGTDLAISITGIAGPDGGSEAKPVGTFYIGLATETDTWSFHHLYFARRAAVRRYAAYMALDTIRRLLSGLPFYRRIKN